MKLKVMLVDDEPFILQGLSMIVDWEKEGYEVSGMFERSGDALEAIGEIMPDLVITDINMPEISGLELVRKALEKGTVDTHFVILSGYSKFEYVREAMQLQCMDYLLKPIDREELLTILAKVRENRCEKVRAAEEAKAERKKESGRPLAAEDRESSDVQGTAGQSLGVLSQIERDLREHYRENLTLKDLSKKYFINSVYLGQLFKKQYGEGFKDYLNRIRVEKAKELLQTTDLKIYEIAERVGYKDLDYFINKFIGLIGCTPSRFRKTERKL